MSYQLCYIQAIVPTTKTESIAVDFIEDVDGLLKAQSVLKRCIIAKDLIRYVEDAYQDYTEYSKTVTEPSREADIKLERLARSYFLEFSVFLEHWKSYIRANGKWKQFKTVFEQQTHDAFDSSDSYALVAMLRNYIAHSANIVQGKFWGAGHYDIGCSKEVLLQDPIFNETKKAIIQRQPAQLISLTPIMRGALDKLREIHKAFLTFDFGETELLAATVVEKAIEAVREHGMDNRHFQIVNTVQSYITTYTPDNKPIETVPVTETFEFDIPLYEEAIALVKACVHNRSDT